MGSNDESEFGVIARQTVFDKFFGKDGRSLMVWKSLVISLAHLRNEKSGI